MTKKQINKWSQKVTSKENYHTPEGLFKKAASVIANTLENESDSCAQAVERLNFYVNRAGKNLSKEDRARLEAAKKNSTLSVQRR
jgi:hypothetical protein